MNIEIKSITSEEEVYERITSYSHSTNVVKISVRNSSLSLQSAAKLATIITTNAQTLTSVDLVFCGLPKILSRALGTCNNIKVLNFIDLYGDEEVSQILPILVSNVQSVNFLCIFAENASRQLYEALAEVVNKFTALRTLILQSKHGNGKVDSFYQALYKNTSLTRLEIYDITSRNVFDELFERNHTIVEFEPFPRYGYINEICRDLGATDAIRKSIPKRLETKEEIRHHVTELIKQGIPWKAIKIIVLGHGEVGKTTLLHALKRYQEKWLQRKVNNVRFPLKQNVGVARTVGAEISDMNIGKGSASVWDFGGQLEYRATHQYLLSVERVLYILCYDLSAPEEIRNQQLAYWLSFLQSVLPGSVKGDSKWRVLVVGTKSDMCIHSNQIPNPIPSWKAQWPTIPFHDYHFMVSSHKHEGVQELLTSLEQICNRIFAEHSLQIPATYATLLESFQKAPATEFLQTVSQIYAKNTYFTSCDDLLLALKYLHAIGHVILLKGDLVCTTPQIVPAITAEFISPRDVRQKLLVEHRVEILDQHQIGAILSVSETDRNLDEKLTLMTRIGVCFKLVSKRDSTPGYLFPSLASFSDKIGFAGNLQQDFKSAGFRIIAPQQRVFTPGFMCQLLVEFFTRLNITRRELAAVHSNGVVLSCQSLFYGQLVIKLENGSKSLVFLMMAQQLYLAYISSLFRKFVSAYFEQYDGYEEQTLCPECVLQFAANSERIGFLDKGLRPQKMCLPNLLHDVSTLGTHNPNLSMLKMGVRTCKAHAKDSHHVFISYRVMSEGNKSVHSQNERGGGFVELLYDLLAPQKLDGEDIFVFWDKMCLNDGQNWEEGFLHGITSSAVIILILSNKVIEGISSKAGSGQDNVLVEYECALLQNILKGTPVIPLFLAEMTGSNQYEKFDFGKATTSLPDAPHKREKKAQSLIDKLKEPLRSHEVEFLDSISKTMHEIFRLQGGFLVQRGEDLDALDEFVERVTNVLQKILAN